ncbi:aldose epimerase family protein [Aestuariivirga sp.]|uniref:aldose epimerase family protein n=1 Tax=Aestuariivirga sp. TaxID=2650926 RepID=UPI0039E2CF65
MIEIRSKSLRAVFNPFGARLVSLFTDGVDVVAGGDGIADVAVGEIYAGTTCGRIAGRITNARFPLDGRIVEVAPNMEGRHQLHGGPDNFAIRTWEAKATGDSVRFSLTSADGDQGYPGKLDVTATYAIEDNVLSADFEARTDKPTIINLTNHAYWNMAGKGSGLAQAAVIDAHSYLPLDSLKLPTGEVKLVDGTRFDFRKERVVGEVYDHAFILNGARGDLKRAIRLSDPESGRAMEIFCTEGCLQFYTAEHWGPSIPGKYGPLAQYGAIALEAQNFPDAPNHANFPSGVLRPGETYRHRIEWRF